MSNPSEERWFYEVFPQAGTSFGLEVTSKLHSEKSSFQTIDIYQTTTFGKLMVLDGCIMVSERDHFIYHEMITHPGLFTHPNPRRVAIIGGGDCGTLKEVLKHDNVEAVTQIEIDERVTRMSEQYFPELCELNHDKRATFRFEDGIKWIKAQPAGTWDVIIIDSTDPVGPAKDLFSDQFLSACFKALGEHGILVQQSESPILHTHSIIRDLQRDLNSVGFNHVHTLPFPLPVYPSGWWSATMASKSVKPEHFRNQDAQNKSFDTHYYNHSIHQAALAQPEFMKLTLA